MDKNISAMIKIRPYVNHSTNGIVVKYVIFPCTTAAYPINVVKKKSKSSSTMNLNKADSNAEINLGLVLNKILSPGCLG